MSETQDPESLAREALSKPRPPAPDGAKQGGTQAEIYARRLRVLQHKYRSGLTVTLIAQLEKVHHTTIVRDLQWWARQWKRSRKDGGKYVDELCATFDQVRDAAANERVGAKTIFEKTRCMMVMIAASMAKAKILLEAGRIGPDKDDTDKVDRYAPSEVRRMAEAVRGHLEGDVIDDLVPAGERAFLNGVIDAETIDEDEDDE